MKKVGVFMLLMFAFVLVDAQGPGGAVHEGGKGLEKDRKEKLKAFKIGYITEKLSLTSEEAAVFWPIYNDYQDKKMKLRFEKRKLKKGVRKKEVLSDAEMEKIVDQEIETREKLLALDKAFHLEVKKILPIKKVFLLYRAEHEFKKQLIDKMRKNKGQGRRRR